MIESSSSWEIFEDLVKKILEANNFQISVNDVRGDKGFDFIGRLGGDRWAIEVKYYRTARVRASLIDSAATRVVNNGTNLAVSNGMLVISSRLQKRFRTELEEKYSIVFLDRSDLRGLASVAPDLLDQLDALLETDVDARVVENAGRPNFEKTKDSIRKKSTPPNDIKGTELCDRLRSLKRGKHTWVAYEKLCIEILKYLFRNDLEGWHSQKSTEGGTNRYDYVCRVKPTTEYWKFIVDNLNSRYVVFEFKNYAEKIKQGQVLTTEKYLLERGLRRVALIITRLGSDKNANIVMQGAMREHGKLIICVDLSIIHI